MKLVVHKEASAESMAAAEWYERRREGLGLEFLDEVDRALAIVAESPETWPRDEAARRPSVRRFLLPRFPFAVIYEVRDQHVLVAAIAHTSRRPGYWARRLLEP